MTETVFIEGPGAGTIRQVDLPARGTVQRQLLDAQLATGEMKILDAADVEEVEYVQCMGVGGQAEPLTATKFVRKEHHESRQRRPARH